MERDRGVSSNLVPTSGRLFLIVVDENNLRPGAIQGMLRAAERLLAGMPPGDLVGVARLPGGGGVSFTADRDLILGALRQVSGNGRRLPNLGPRVFLSEATDFVGTQRDQWPRALQRECGNPRDPNFRPCRNALEVAANELLQDEAQKTSVTTAGLRQVMSALEGAQTPVTILLISEGLFIAQDASGLAGLAADGAAARVSMQVVRPVPPMGSVASTGIPIDPVEDEALREAGLTALAAQFRGGFFRLVGEGQGVFDRLQRELSGYYLIGIASLPEDRTGRPRPVHVEVRRKDMTVRARPSFVVPTAPSTPSRFLDQRVNDLLRTVVPVRGLPIRLVTRTMPASSGHVQLLVSAEIGADVTANTSHTVGFVLIDDAGTVVHSRAGTVSLAPARPDVASPALFTTTVDVAPGDYSLRLAAIDGAGAAGSVHAALSARPTRAGERLLSDLIVAPEPRPDAYPVFTPSAVIDGTRVAALLEVSDSPARLRATQVRFDVISRESRETLSSAIAQPQATPDAGTARFSAIFALDRLRRGEYTLRATVLADGEAEPAVDRPFRLEPATGVAPLPMIREALDDLTRVVQVSPSLAAFVARAKSGIFEAPPDADSRPAGDVAVVTFVTGLAALREGRTSAAHALFEQTRRSAPAFTAIEAFLRRAR